MVLEQDSHCCRWDGSSQASSDDAIRSKTPWLYWKNCELSMMVCRRELSFAVELSMHVTGSL